METRRTSFLAILLIAAQFGIYFNSTVPAQARVVSDTSYEKIFSQKLVAIEIENANGRTAGRVARTDATAANDAADGVDNSPSDEDYEPKHPFDEVFARISQDEITIYPIYFDTGHIVQS